jgi:hypothetical protein
MLAWLTDFYSSGKPLGLQEDIEAGRKRPWRPLADPQQATEPS